MKKSLSTAFLNFLALGALSLGLCANICHGQTGGGVFVTGHDPDFHAVQGANALGAQHITQRAIAYVTNGRPNPRILLVTDLRNPGGVQSDSRLGLIYSGYPTFDITDYGSGQQGALDLHTVNFSNYDVVVVASDFGGWLHQEELDLLNARKDEVIAYVNNGGGLVVFAESGQNIYSGAPPPATTTHDRFGFLPFLVSGVALDQHESSIAVTPAGVAMGLTNNDANGNFSHNYFIGAGGMDVIDLDGANRIITLATRQQITASGVGGNACTTTVNVPGTANPYLAGLPSGSPAAYGDSAPGESPTPVTGLSIEGGDRLQFAATGTVGYAPGVYDAPDGTFGVVHLAYLGLPGAENGFSSYYGPADALIAVFLDDSLPTSTAAPSRIMENDAASLDYTTLSPGLKQIFFVGDGKRTNGDQQTVIAPPGATRLYLGTLDGFGWYNNGGAFTVQISNLDCLDAVLSEPPGVAGGLPPDGTIFGTPDPLHPGHTTGTLRGTGHPGCTVEVTVSDPDHASIANNGTYTTTVDAQGNWSLTLTLDDCDPEISIVQICDGARSEPVKWRAAVDGTPPIFVSGGPGDGVDYIGTGGTVDIPLDGSATDPGSHAPGGLTYQWTLIGAGGVRQPLSDASGVTFVAAPGEYDIEVVVTDPARNRLTKRCHRRVLKRPSTLGCPATTVQWGGSVVLNAPLTDALTNQAITGKVISYKLNGVAVSNPFNATLLPGVYQVLASFAGDDIYQPCTSATDCRLTITGVPGKITGGGSTDERIRNFGFVVQVQTQAGKTSFSGNLEFQDKSRNLNLACSALTMIAISPDRLHGVFTGNATMNKVAGYTFTCWVDDLAEPGAGVDKFRVEIKGPGGFTYDSATVATKGGILDKGGNIQIHKP